MSYTYPTVQDLFRKNAAQNSNFFFFEFLSGFCRFLRENRRENKLANLFNKCTAM